MSALWKFDFQKKKKIHFSGENDLNCKQTKTNNKKKMNITFSLGKWKQEQAVDPFGSPKVVY